MYNICRAVACMYTTFHCCMLPQRLPLKHKSATLVVIGLHYLYTWYKKGWWCGLLIPLLLFKRSLGLSGFLFLGRVGCSPLWCKGNSWYCLSVAEQEGKGEELTSSLRVKEQHHRELLADHIGPHDFLGGPVSGLHIDSQSTGGVLLQGCHCEL